MATTENLANGTGSQDTFSFTFPYITDTDIKVSVGGVVKTVTTHYTLHTPTTIKFTSGNIPPSGTDNVRIYRETADTALQATFYPGSAIRAGDLNDNFTQNLYVVQESNNKIDSAWQTGDETIDSTETWHTSDDTRIGTTKAIENRIDTKIDTALTTDVVGGQSITVTDDSPSSGKITLSVTGSSIRTDELAVDAVTGAKLANDACDSEHYTDGSIDTQHIADGQITHVKLGGDCVDGDNISDDSINSEHYVDGSIDHVHLSGDCIDGDNIQDDVIDSEHIVAGALDEEHYATGSITSAKLNAATVVTNSEQAAATANDTSFFTTAAADARYFNISTGDTIKDGVTFPDNDTTIATTAAINDRILDLVDEVGGFLPIANETSFPTANPDPENGTGTIVSIQALASNLVSNGSGVATIANAAGSGVTVTINGLANSTTYAATFGMLVETTSVTHTYKFHRQTPKATEVTTVAGGLTNINTVATNISNINTLAGINANVTTVAGISSNVTSVAGNATNINTVASNITDVSNFADLYQIATSAPTQDGGGNSLATGDLWFDSSSNKALMIYDGSSGDGFSAATPTASVLQDIAIVSGQITFAEDLGAVGDALTTGTGNNINTVASGIANVNTVAGISANVTTVAGISSNVTSVAGAVANINTTASNLASINNFAEVYRIAATAPSSSLHEGDLWYDSDGNTLKYYNGTTWTVTAAAGLSNIVEDTSPELGGHLDCNDKQLTEVGTISGDNLQIDFGTIS